MNSENMKRLYAAAESFRKLAPWEWMDDDRIFGVKNPETGVIDYCGVLGGLGEVFALVVYEGPEGLHGYLKLLSGELGEAGPHIIEYQRALMASFDDRRDLAPEDLAVIRSLNLKFRGKNAWPLFRHYLPGYLPWFVTEAQAQVLRPAWNRRWTSCPATAKIPICCLTRIPAAISCGCSVRKKAKRGTRAPGAKSDGSMRSCPRRRPLKMRLPTPFPPTRSASPGSAVSRKSVAAFGRSAVVTPPRPFRNGATNAPICRDSWESSRREAV
jgi:hypothetical protein